MATSSKPTKAKGQRQRAERPTASVRVEASPASSSGIGDWLRGFLHTSPALAFSLLLHVLVIMVLGIATIATVQRKPELVLTATSVEGEAVEEISEFEFETVEDLSMDTETEIEPEVVEMVEVETTDVQLPMTEVESAVAAAVAGAAESSGSANSAAPPKRSDRPQSKNVVQFAGTSAAGNRFAFVVDNSKSMVNGRMLATIDQLLSAVNQMKPQQEFFVVLYSDTAYPMFFPDSASDFLPATKPNKRQLRDWLKTIEINDGGNYETALNLIFNLRPDAIFLLGDGGGLGKEEMELLVGFNPRRKCVINTIGVGVGPKRAQVLQQIAQANRGMFRVFATPPAFVQMSRSMKFPVNSARHSWAKRLGKK